MRRLILQAFLILGLAGCASTTEVYYIYQQPPFSQSLVQYAAQSGEFPVQVKGNPFAEPVPAEAIANAVPMPGWLTVTKPTTHWGPKANSNFRLVLAFNPVYPAESFDNLCRDLDKFEVKPADGKTTVVMGAFCSQKTAVSQALAKAPQGTGLNDKVYQTMMYDLMASLFPSFDPGILGPCTSAACD